MSGQDNRFGFGEFWATLLIPGGGIASQIVIRLGHDRSVYAEYAFEARYPNYYPGKKVSHPCTY